MGESAIAFVTEAEFLALPETNQPMELIDGELIVPPAPTLRHQNIVKRLVVGLDNWAAGREASVAVAQSPVDVRLASGRIVQPDVMVFIGELPDEDQHPIEVIPALCIEVVSGRKLYDRVTKRYLYADAGVREYWTIVPPNLVERWTGERLDEREIVSGALTSTRLPDFEMSLAKLFGG